MSKFVTYGVTEMLDNDQKFIIDSDRTGPGSITAKDAASSLLSKWAGFETFEEAVQNTISNNQEFIDRDTAIREETAELKKKIVTTFPAKEASGAVATFESEFEDAPLKSCIVQIEPVQDLHGYDSPWPAGGGKNKVNIPNISIEAGVDKQLGIGTVILPAGTYTLSYTLSATVTATRNRPLYFLNRVAYFGNDIKTAGRGSWTFTLEEQSTLEFKWWMHTVSAVCTISDFQLELGSTATSYVPYENICPITGWTGCEVQRTGKNVWDEEWEIGNISTTTGEPISSGDKRIRSKNFIPCFPSTPYYVIDPTSGNNIRLFFYADDGSFITAGKWTGNAIQTTPTKARFMRFIMAVSYGITYNNDISINYPSTDHDYHSGTQNTTYPITFPSEAGTVYGAYVDVTGGELVVDRYFGTILPNKVNISTSSNGYFWYTTIYSLSYPSIKSDNAKLIANRLRMIANTKESDPDGVMSVYGNGIIRWKEHGEMSLYEYKAYLAENPLYFCYEVKEPIHYPLTPTEIKTLLGQNNIWSNTGDTSVEYLMSDVSWYVEKKLRAFQSILAGVEDSTSASKNYSANTYLIFNNDIYRVTKAITAGETIEEGVNVTKTTVAEQLMALAQA